MSWAARIAIALGIALLGGGLLLFWMSGGLPRPAEEDAPILKGEWAKDLPPNPVTSLRVLSFNMHYGVGAPDDRHQRASAADIERNLDRIGHIIRQMGIDVALLQEVDFCADRTGCVNEMERIAKAAGMRYMAPAVTWLVNYLPFPYWPPSDFYGKIDSGQVVLSRWPITLNRRLALPKPEEWSFLYRAFYLERVIQHVRLNVAGTPIDILNIHAESGSVPARQLHAERIRDYARPFAKGPLLVAGDFNATPPEAAKRHDFADEPEQDQRQDRSVATLRETGLQEIIPADRYRLNETQALTFPAPKPTRRLDYLYYSASFSLEKGRVLTEVGPLSDHLPLFASFLLKKPPPNPVPDP